MLLWLISREEKDNPINVNGGDDKSRPSVKRNDAFPVLTLWLLSTGDLQWGETVPTCRDWEAGEEVSILF